MAPVTAMLLSALFVATAALAETIPHSSSGKGKYSQCTDDTGALCMDSFVWCKVAGNGCDFPDYTYPARNSGKGSVAGLVLWDHDYNISWSNASPDYPTLLEWSFKIGENSTTRWSKNVTEGETSYVVNFKNMADELSDDEETSWSEGKAYAAEVTNYLEASQPENRQVESNPIRQLSDMFSVLDEVAATYLEAAKSIGKDDANLKAWRLGVGIGVGLGVPILMAAAFMVGRVSGKRGKQARNKDIAM